MKTTCFDESESATFAEHVRACRLAYEEKRLGAQRPEVSNGMCFYVYPGHPECGCAIGVGLRPSVRTHLAQSDYLNGKEINYLIELIAFDFTPNEHRALCRLQAAHDDWVRRGKGTDRRAFVEQLELCERMVADGEAEK